MRLALGGSVLLLACVPAGAADDAKDAERVRALRGEVLKNVDAAEDKSAAAAAAYKALFTHVGLAGLKKLAEDDDTSIALQAAWELHRKAVKRDPPIRGRTDWVFDRKPMEEVIGFVAKRLQAEPPAWWRSALLKGDAWPDRQHAFIDRDGDPPAAPEVAIGKDEVTITSGKRSIKLPKAVYDKAEGFLDLGTAPAALLGAELSVVARPVGRGYPFNVVAVDTRTGRGLWTALVWAARRGPSSGPAWVSPVEVRRHKDTAVVYGCESHGLYAEGFDAKTGQCRFRFCTCYWFNFSEEWGLK